MHKKRSLFESFNAAVEGIVHVVRTQRNMRLHFLIAVFILVASLFLDLRKVEIISLAFAIVLVLITEMINTVVEAMVDLQENHIHPTARLIKDVSAGAVLVSAINAVAVGYFLFFTRLVPRFPLVIAKIRQAPPYLTFIALVLVSFLVIAAKAHFRSVKEIAPPRRLSLLRGGMPSGHAAMAFAVWTIVCFISHNLLVSTLVFFLSVMISWMRVREGVHTSKEVFIGGILGILATVFIFQIFS